MMPIGRPLMWTLTASDTCAGAGMQADLAVAHALDVDCHCVVIAITSQNSHGLQAAQALPLTLIQQQWLTLAADGWPAVIRLGWLPADAALIDWLCEVLESCPAQVVWDPVKTATQVDSLSADFGSGTAGQKPLGLAGWQRLLPRVDVLTPNFAEAGWLAGAGAADSAAEIGQRLLDLGVGTVLITGGDRQDEHLDDGKVRDVCLHRPAADCDNPEELALTEFVIEHQRLPYRAHGTGCHLAAALAAALARGERRYDAVLTAVTVARASLANASERLSGYHNCFATLPAITAASELSLSALRRAAHADDSDLRLPLRFPRLDRPLGLYGLVDNLDWLQRLLELGVDTLQWRVKTREAGFREATAEAIRRCREAGVPLYINDYWQLALELDAWGVHLGQEDLADADLQALAEAGIALGVSTHTEWEIARARSIQPSYIAFGPVFPPLSKKLKYPPLGVERLRRWVAANSDFPLTTIGGITPDNLAEVLSSGIDSVAIVTALTNDAGLEQRMKLIQQQWLDAGLTSPGLKS